MGVEPTVLVVPVVAVDEVVRGDGWGDETVLDEDLLPLALEVPDASGSFPSTSFSPRRNPGVARQRAGVIRRSRHLSLIVRIRPIRLRTKGLGLASPFFEPLVRVWRRDSEDGEVLGMELPAAVPVAMAVALTRSVSQGFPEAEAELVVAGSTFVVSIPTDPVIFGRSMSSSSAGLVKGGAALLFLDCWTYAAKSDQHIPLKRLSLGSLKSQGWIILIISSKVPTPLPFVRLLLSNWNQIKEK